MDGLWAISCFALLRHKRTFLSCRRCSKCTRALPMLTITGRFASPRANAGVGWLAQCLRHGGRGFRGERALRSSAATTPRRYWLIKGWACKWSPNLPMAALDSSSWPTAGDRLHKKEAAACLVFGTRPTGCSSFGPKADLNKGAVPAYCRLSGWVSLFGHALSLALGAAGYDPAKSRGLHHVTL